MLGRSSLEDGFHRKLRPAHLADILPQFLRCVPFHRQSILRNNDARPRFSTRDKDHHPRIIRLLRLRGR